MSTYRTPNRPGFEEFARSTLYGAFVRFGRYVGEINAISPHLFVDFLLKAEVKIDRWCNASVYETYLRELNKIESPDAAVERNILLMQAWANERPERHWTNFFREVEPALAAQWIKSGRVSPWVLMVAASAADLLTRMSDEQIGVVNTAVDPAFWEKMIEKHRAEVDQIRQIMAEAGI
jgi:hypothetical protein